MQNKKIVVKKAFKTQKNTKQQKKWNPTYYLKYLLEEVGHAS